MKQSNFTSLQFACLIYFPILALFSGIGTYSIIKISRLDAYLSVVVAFLLGGLMLMNFLYIFNYKPEMNIVNKINYLFGPIWGKGINYLIDILTLIIGIVLVYNISNFAISQFLSETPMLVFMLILGSVIVYNVSYGIENISRVSLIFFVIICFLTVISTLGIIPFFKVSNLKPFLEQGIKTPLYGGFILSLMNVVPIFTLLIVEKKRIKENDKVNKKIILFYALAFLFDFLAIILTIGALGIYLSEFYQYPEYTVLKKISLFNFIDRIENFIYIKWILSSYICLSLIVYYVSYNLKKTSRKIAPVIVMLLMIIVSLYFFKNNTIFYFFSYSIFPFTNFLLLLIYLVIGIRIFMKKRRENGK